MKQLIASFILLGLSQLAVAAEHYVVVGSFAAKEAADSELVRLKTKEPGLSILATERGNAPLYRIVLGPFKSSFAAEQRQLDLVQSGFSEAWTYSQPDASSPAVAAATLGGTNESSSRKLKVSQQKEVEIKRFRYASPVLQDEVAQILGQRSGRTLSSTEILATREAINQLYAREGYVNSGMVIPDQQINDGELALTFISGTVTGMNIDSDLRDRYIKSRLDITEPFNLFALQQSLKALEQDPMVKRIDAEVAPGIHPGEANLALTVETTSKLEVSMHAANDRSPSIGAENAELGVKAKNLSGWGETLGASTSVTEGLDALSAFFHVPLSAKGAGLRLKYALSDSSVIEEPFDDIDVESETESVSVILTYPIFETLTTHLDAELTMEVRRNETELLGQKFSFSEGAINGESKVAPVRLALAYLKQNLDDSLAARLSISRGTSNFDASDGVGVANGTFTSYLAQVQYSRRLGERSHMTLRALGQYASDPLLSVEKFALGGIGSVRGYRQNQVVRDNATLVSAEYHYRLDLPVQVTLVGFAEWGKGENHDDASLSGSEDLASIGIGLVLANWHGISAELYLAHGFDDFTAQEHDLQDDGVHFRLGYRYEF